MSKYNLSWDEKKLNRYIKERRGLGTGKEYKPWITIHDFPSNGFSSRQPGWKSNRVCQFLSHHELRYFYLLEWSDCITDIREQFPMDLQETLNIADKLGLKHPEDRNSKTPYVMTSDFMITLNINGKELYMVRSVKPASDLEKKSFIEHLEIERRYWTDKNIDWGIVTDNEIPEILTSNIEWVYYSYNLEPGNDIELKDLLYYGEVLKERLQRQDGKIIRIASEYDKEMNLAPGTSLDIIKHLIARKEIIMDVQTMLCVNNSTESIIKVINKNDRLTAI